MYGALEVLRETQGRTDNAWRDEEPGKMLHEAHTGPVGVLNFSPRGAYYGEFTSTPFYIVVLSELYHWTGDKSAMLRHLPVARACMRWIDRYGDLDGDGFYEYRSRSSQGVKNQAWKDSGDAIVDDKGRIVDTPLGTCEQQGFVYEAKLRMAELLWLIGERGEAKRCFHQAQELKKRFNDRFWMKDERFFAMAKDRKGRLVRSISSNPGDALATGIIDAEHAKPTADRLFAPDLFSGWGIRTLSTEHPAYNPYSYHRGSVWPAENAAIAVGLRRYGFTDRLQQLTSALLQVASLFDQQRLPEVFSGHGQNERHPFPAVYPEACAPQAWSASAVLILQQMLLGIYPYAPMNLLFVEPALPEWMPNTPLRNLNVGKHRVSLEFTRSADGHTNYKVLDNPGNVRVIRQPSPWSVYASPLRRIEELIESLAA
jgi:glycogen debranching enzyme